MQAQRVVDLAADRAQRIQRSQGVLQHESHIAPADTAPLPLSRVKHRPHRAAQGSWHPHVLRRPVRPISDRAVTLLPDPDSPTRAKHSPGEMSNETPRTTSPSLRRSRCADLAQKESGRSSIHLPGSRLQTAPEQGGCRRGEHDEQAGEDRQPPGDAEVEASGRQHRSPFGGRWHRAQTQIAQR